MALLIIPSCPKIPFGSSTYSFNLNPHWQATEPVTSTYGGYGGKVELNSCSSSL
eukprot:14553.XXX_768605_768766_1 [CDS] Oithona nana genome sequencing.